jgi:hypothetical protein
MKALYARVANTGIASSVSSLPIEVSRDEVLGWEGAGLGMEAFRTHFFGCG